MIFDPRSTERIARVVRRVERESVRQQNRRVYRNPMGGGGGATYRGVFPALLTHVQQCDGDAGLPVYTWAEAEIGECGAQVKSGGRSGGATVLVVRNFSQIRTTSGSPEMTFPYDGAVLPGTVTPGSPDAVEIEFTWTDAPGSSPGYWLAVGEVPPPPTKVNLYHDEDDDLGEVLSHAVAGIPADGRTLRVRVWNWDDWNEYEFTIEEEPSALAICVEDINALARGDDAPVPAEYDNTGDDWVPAEETALDTPILAILLESRDVDNNLVYLFVRGGGGGGEIGDVVAGPETDSTSIVTNVSNVDPDTCTIEKELDTIEWVELVVNGVRIGWIRALEPPE